MHNIISRKNLVAILKCVPLRANQIWDIYAYRTIHLRSNCQFSSKEIFRAPCCQVQRQDQELDMTASSESLSTISRLYVQSCKSCEFWGVPCLPQTTLWSSSPRLKMRRKPMMVS